VSDQYRGFEIGFRIDLICMMAFWILLWVTLGCVAAQRISGEAGSAYKDALVQV